MDNAPGWRPDPEREDQERYWNGSAWTDRVRPAGKARSLHLPEHVPELQRALAAATADIDAVEDRLSNLFDRTEGAAPHASPVPQPPPPPQPDADDEEIVGLYDEDDVAGSGEEDATDLEADGGAPADQADGTDHADDTEHADGTDHADDADDDGAFAELDAALAAEKPEKPKRGLFRRRS